MSGLASSVELYLAVGAVLFTCGVVTMTIKRNLIGVLMGVELVLNGANLNFVAFWRFTGHGIHNQVFAVFVITVAAAEAAVGLGIVIALFSNRETVNVDEIDLMKG